MPLTDRQIKNAKAKAKPYELADGGGLHVWVSAQGKKFFRLKYRFNGKEKTLSMGAYPAVSLGEARALHDEAKALLAKGIDPSQAKQAAVQEKKQAAANSFACLAREWHSKNNPRWNERHAAKVLHSLERDAFPLLGALAITDIKAPVLLSMVNKIEARGAAETAKRVLQRVKSVFNYAIQTGRAVDNPALTMAGVVVSEPAKHFAALPQAEIGEFYRRLLAEPMREQTRLALLLIMLTFSRAGNIRYAEWGEIDREKRQWAIPAGKMKMNAPHIVPLSDWALALLDELHALTGHSRYLFPSISNPHAPMSENTLGYAMGRMGYHGIATPHGFRSLASDILNEHGFNPDAIERQLAHKEKNKVRAAYHRTEYLPQREEMMQWYSDYLRAFYEAAQQ